MKKSLLLLGLLSLLLATPAAHAARPQPNHNMWEIGLFLGVALPDSDHQLINLDINRTFQPLAKAAFDIGLRVAYLPLSWLGLELEGALIPTSTRDAGDWATVYSIRGHLLLQYPWWITPFIVGGVGAWGIGSDALGNDVDGYPHWGLGAKLFATRWLAIRIDGRHIIGSDLVHEGWVNHFEFLLGASWVIGMKEEKAPPKDSDGDGIVDDEDKCPEEAGNPPDGCPAPKDSDGDGIADAEDKCPDQAGNPPDGCPDRDGDGILDKEDRCPDQKGTAELQGCPDGDGDGIADVDDACPTAKGPAKLQGCPDRDGDGIPDKDDQCPDVAGLKEKQGCMPEAAKKFSGVIKGITFAFGSAKIKPQSFALLNEAAKLMTEYPSMLLAIEGHTDNVGKPEKNQALSEARAEAVKDYLVGKGIDTDRLSTKGYGDTQPVQENKTVKGRAANRRIEFKISGQ